MPSTGRSRNAGGISPGPSSCDPPRQLLPGRSVAGAAAEAGGSTVSIALPDEEFAPTYARLLAALRARGRSVATMDLLIATAAVCDGAPLVTRNPRHFLPVPGLKVVTY